MKTIIAVLQYDVPEKTNDSFVKLDEMVNKAVKLGARLVVAPETAIGDGIEVKETGVDYFSRLAELAYKHRVYLSTSFYRKIDIGMINQGYIIDPDGKSLLEYKKIYPAKPEVENLSVVAGNEIRVVETEIGKLGMLICKDGFNRYSHFLYEKLGELGAEIICIPSWSIGWKEMNTQEYFKSLYVYGSFASRAYVLMSDCTNTMFNSFGRSLIVSPIRGVLKEGSIDKEEILIEELDLDEVKKARQFDSWWQPKSRKV
jgi:predicted amidohydrolase